MINNCMQNSISTLTYLLLSCIKAITKICCFALMM